MAGIIDDIADGQSLGHTAVGAAVDFGLFAITKFIPVVGWITLWYDIGNLLDKLDGKDSGIFDLRKQAQNLWDKISGDGLSDIDQEALKNGILKITMPDNTVYARPLSSSFFPYGVTPSGLLTGDYKDDVLFGGYGDDTLMGKMVVTYSSAEQDTTHTTLPTATLSVTLMAKAKCILGDTN